MKFLIVIPLFFLFSCAYDPATGILNVKNKSNYAIYICPSCSDSIKIQDKIQLYVKQKPGFYKDGRRKDTIVYPSCRANPNDTAFLHGFGTTKKRQILCGHSDRINIFFISEYTLKSKTWDEICKNQLFEKRLTFTNAQLDSLDWNIVYDTK